MHAHTHIVSFLLAPSLSAGQNCRDVKDCRACNGMDNPKILIFVLRRYTRKKNHCYLLPINQSVLNILVEQSEHKYVISDSVAPWMKAVHNVQAEMCFHRAFGKHWWINYIAEDRRITYYLPRSLLLPTSGLVLLDTAQRQKDYLHHSGENHAKEASFPIAVFTPQC